MNILLLGILIVDDYSSKNVYLMKYLGILIKQRKYMHQKIYGDMFLVFFK